MLFMLSIDLSMSSFAKGSAMAVAEGKSGQALTCRRAIPHSKETRRLGSDKDYTASINNLLEASPAEFAQKDIATLNLLCAPSLPGSEHLNISKCLARLDQLTAFVKATMDRNFHRFPKH